MTFKPNMEEYLVDCGYQREDALKMVLAYIGGGLTKVKKEFANKNNLKEIIKNIEKYITGK